MKMVACGWRHTIVVSEAGNIYSYGWSKYGQLGHGTFQDLLVPHQVLVLNDRKIESVCLCYPYRGTLQLGVDLSTCCLGNLLYPLFRQRGFVKRNNDSL